MGCDGGTIPKRCELVKEKKKKEQKDKYAEMYARWLLCALSQLQLQKPIVACELGRLYSKESVLELLLDRSKFESAEHFSHIRSLKDVYTLNLTPNPASSNGNHASSSAEESSVQFICPVSQLEMNGKHKFVYFVTCCCVLSERALREIVPKNKISEENVSCPVCAVPFSYQNDVVVLNPDDEEDVTNMKKNMEKRRLLQKANKVSKKKADRQASEQSIKRPLSDGKKDKLNEVKKARSDSTASNNGITNGIAKGKYPDSEVYRSLFLPSSSQKQQPTQVRGKVAS